MKHVPRVLSTAVAGIAVTIRLFVADDENHNHVEINVPEPCFVRLWGVTTTVDPNPEFPGIISQLG